MFVASLQRAAQAAAARAGVHTVELAPAGVPIRAQLVGTELTTRLAPGLLARPAAAAPRADAAAPTRTGAAEPLAPAAELWAFDTAGSGIAAPRPPWGTADYLQREEIAGWVEPPRLAAYDLAHATLSVADVDARVGVQWMRDAAGMAPWEGGSPLRSLLRWTLAEHGVHLLHAAVVGTDAGGVLLAGPGGAGKSTAALACLQAGMRFVSDDYCLVRTGPRPTAHPLFAVAKASPRTLELLGGGGLAERAAGAVVDWRGKRRLPVGDLVSDELPLRAVVLPRVGERTGSALPLTRGEALRPIATSTLFQLPGAAGRTLAALRELLDAVPAYALEVGPDVEAIPAALAALAGQAAAA